MSAHSSSATGSASAASDALRHAVLVMRHNMNLLQLSLMKGDLATARSSFAALSGLTEAPTPEVHMSTQAVTAGGRAYVELHRALHFGYLQEARRAFCTLMSFLRSHPPVHRHHRRAERFPAEMALATCVRSPRFLD